MMILQRFPIASAERVSPEGSIARYAGGASLVGDNEVGENDSVPSFGHNPVNFLSGTSCLRARSNSDISDS
jgi:hypothetical protein